MTACGEAALDCGSLLPLSARRGRTCGQGDLVVPAWKLEAGALRELSEEHEDRGLPTPSGRSVAPLSRSKAAFGVGLVGRNRVNRRESRKELFVSCRADVLHE